MNKNVQELVRSVQALYDEGCWMLPVDKHPLERQVQLWDHVKNALENMKDQDIT